MPAMSELQRRLGRLPLERRVRFLSLLRSGGETRPADRPVPLPRTGAIPASYAQSILWFQDRVAPGQSTYHVTLCFRCRGPLDVAGLGAALTTVVARHEALRTTLPERDGGPVQQIAAPAPVELAVHDVPGDDPDARHTRGVALAREFALAPFDLAAGPLWRAAVYRTGEQDHLFVFSVHHAVFDGMSVGVFAGELSRLYEAGRAGVPADLSELPIQYADYSMWQRDWLAGDRRERLVSYWREQLADVPLLEVPADRPRPAKLSYAGDIAQQPIPQSTVDAVHTIAREMGVTPYVVYLSTLFLLLQRHTGQDDLVVGASTAGRSRPELEALIGCFVNVLAIRANLPGEPTFRDAVRHVDGVVREAFAHGDLPFGQVVEALGGPSDPARAPIAQVVFNVLGDLPMPSFGGVEVEPELLAQRTAKFDITLEVADAGPGAPAHGSRIGAEYSTDLYDAETIEALLDQYARLLGRVTAEPDRAVRSTDLMTAGQVDELIHGWNGVRRPVRPLTVHGWFERQAAATPDAVAVEAGDERLTYGELDRAANRMAHLLRGHGAGPGQLVGLCLARGSSYVVAALGTLKTGAAFLPIDPKHPPARASRILADARPCVLLAEAELAGAYAESGVKAVAVNPADTFAMPDTPPAADVSPADLAYVLYTSGSTGASKGVPIEHHSVVNFVEGVQDQFALTEDDCFLAYASYTFDVSIFEMFGALLTGARLCVALDDDRLDIDRLQALLQRAGVTVTDLPPAVMMLLTPELLDRLRIVFVGGEAFSGEMVNRWNPGRRLFNGYGPTECTVTMTVHECKGRWSGSPPIGLPIRNHVAHVLDRNLDPVPYGVPGELVIGGEGLGRGYLNDPEKSARAFVDDPFGTAPGGRLYHTGDLVKRRRDGALVFLGRVDRQIKVRGIRIEPGEIEAALREHPGIAQALVDVWLDPRGAKRLVAYVVPAAGAEPAAAELSAHAGTLVPAAMVPEFFTVLAEMPLTTSGKVDRRALPAPSLPSAPATAPEHRTETERILATELWAPLLGVPAVDPATSFFDLGGRSLQAAQLLSDIRRRFEVEIGVADFFQNPTVTGLAAVVDKQLAGRVDDDGLLDLLVGADAGSASSSERGN
jgi:amino acid adenylation domain-containing protein